ncbi:MAG: TonB-dependent receptor [Lewinellaceae bacterium]|nr:TonB-dependent receptor [Lewinellaceae bacterium]
MKSQDPKTNTRLYACWPAVLSIFLLLGFSAHANTLSGPVAFRVSGTVTSVTDGLPLVGASVLIKGTSTGTITDIDGGYELDVPDPNDTLVFSYVGYVNQEVPVDGRSTINVALREDATQLDEVVVIGYGTQSRKMLTSSIASVDAEEIQDLQITTLEGVMQGRAAGVSIQTDNGQPGSSPSIRIRGGSSLQGNNEPLFIIDGVQRSSEDFNPEDVASIEILKDASATAIYGARASNGVVLVTTKSGKAGKANFNASYRSTWTSLQNRLDLLGSRDYIEIERIGLTRSFLNENSAFGVGSNATGIGNPPGGNFTLRALEPGESVPAGYESMTDPVTGQTLIFEDVDWQDVAYRPTRMDNVHFSVDGGRDKLSYYLGSSYLSQEGIAKGTSYERFSLQSNVDFQLSEKLNIGTSVNFTRGLSDEPFNSSILFGRAARLAPTTRRFNEDGTVAPGSSSGLPNPEWYASTFLNSSARNKLNLGGSIQYNILENLVATGKLNYFSDQDTREAFVRANQLTSARDASVNFLESRLLQFEGTLKYFKSFGYHNLSLLLGGSNLNTDYFAFSASGQGGPTNSIQTLNASPVINGASSFKSQDKLIGYFGRISYDFAQRYLLSATLRRDGSSRFGTDNQIGYFPSISAGWRLSEEGFFSIPGISDLKLRASWGQTANNDFGNPNDLNRFFLSQGVVDATLTYNGQAAARATQLPNPNLGWETTTQTNFGIDLALFDSRVFLIADYYRKVTSDLLFSNPLPNTSGFGSITQNIGKVEFTGTELSISTDNIASGSLRWTTDFNISFTANKVLELPDNGRDRNRIGGYELSDGTGIGGVAEGEPLRQIVGWQFVKVYPTTAEAVEDGLFVSFANNRTGNNGIDYRNRVGGDVKWEDLNGDKIIDNDDLQVLGYATPDIFGGFGNTISYKGLELYVFLDAGLGHHIYNSNRARMNSNSQGNINGTEDLLRAWNAEGDVTDVPRFIFFDFGNARNHDVVGFGSTTGDGGLADRASSLYTEKGDYLAVRTVRLSYTLPKSVVEGWGLQSVKAYLLGQNLHYFTEYRGYNPEVGALDLGLYPLFRSFSVGLNVGF